MGICITLRMLHSNIKFRISALNVRLMPPAREQQLVRAPSPALAVYGHEGELQSTFTAVKTHLQYSKTTTNGNNPLLFSPHSTNPPRIVVFRTYVGKVTIKNVLNYMHRLQGALHRWTAG